MLYRLISKAIRIGDRHERWRTMAGVRRLAIVAVATLALSTGPVGGQEHRSAVDYPAVPPEQLADVILVLKPHVTIPLHLLSPTERVVQGDIVRVEKGVLPHTIIHTRNTIGSPLPAGVPMKLFLKAFRDGRGHYIIGVYPESYGGQP